MNYCVLVLHYITSVTVRASQICFPQSMKDKMGNSESERRASFYDQTWCHEAVPRYFYAKVKFDQLADVHMYISYVHSLSPFKYLVFTYAGQPTQN